MDITLEAAQPVNDIEAVYRDHAARLWRSLLAWTGDTAITDDAVAEAFAQALRRGDALREPERWVWRTAYRIAAGALKERGRQGGPAPRPATGWTRCPPRSPRRWPACRPVSAPRSSSTTTPTFACATWQRSWVSRPQP